MAAPAPQTAHDLRSAADAAAAQLPALLVQARRVAATVALGSHGRRRAGPGESFWQFRPYSRDDTPQSIDWRQTGKFDVVFVREREWIAAQTVAMWCDCSPSMIYASKRTLPSKAERAAVLTLALAELLTAGGERILRLAADGSPQRAASGRIAVAWLAEALAADMAASAADKAPPAVRFPATLPRHSAAVLIGDLLAPLEETAANIATLAQQGITGHLLQVLDPAEESLPFKGRIRFVGMEAEGNTIVERTEDARDTYTRRMAAHREALRDLTTRAGWTFAVHHTDQPPQLALAALHQVLTGAGARGVGR